MPIQRLAVFLTLPFLFSSAAHAENSLKRYHKSAQAALVLYPERDPEPGRPTRVVAQLSKSGKPLTADDLKTVHTQKVHLLVVDPTLSDYQHLHPEAAATPGSFVFNFTPKLKGGYRVWADVTPADTGEQEFAYADLGAPGPASIDAQISDSAFVKGYHFKLSFDERPAAGEETMLGVRVTDDKGNPVEKLEPVMGAFAHAVGFYDDYQTVVHMHPVGKEPHTDDARGGPTATFHFSPERSGFVRLFVQFKIDGKDVYAPFGVSINKASE